MRRSLRTRLLASFFVAIALPLAALGLFAVQALERATLDHLLDELAALAREAAADAAAEPVQAPVSSWMTRAQVLGVRIALVDGRGVVAVSSGPLPAGITAEPGIAGALRGGVVQGQVQDARGERWLYAAAAVPAAPRGLAAVDVLQPLRSVEGVFTRVRWILAGAFGLAAVLAVALVGYLSHALFSPISAMKAAAGKIGAGDLAQRLREGPDELGELARVLNELARRLDERETVRRDFFANVSHELRSPVANILVTAEALLAGAAEDPEQRRRMLEAIAREAERLARLVRQLLDLLSFQSGRMQLAAQPVAVRDLVEDAVGRFAPRAAALGVALEGAAGRGPGVVDVDPDRMAEVLDNLIDNALRHTPRGGTVRVAYAAEEGGVALRVADTGRGIPAHDLPFVFEKFYRGDAARSRDAGGTGLGLAIVKAIVDAHGGTVAVDSAPGRGATFIVRLPAARHTGAPGIGRSAAAG
jgi:two-component system sensor histidine kinase BaeS